MVLKFISHFQKLKNSKTRNNADCYFHIKFDFSILLIIQLPLNSQEIRIKEICVFTGSAAISFFKTLHSLITANDTYSLILIATV